MCERKDERNTPDCIKCKEFYKGINSDYCSYCDPNRPVSNEDLWKTLYKRNMSQERMDIWITTGVHTLILDQTCSICMEEDIEVINKWCCSCMPIACVNCSKNMAKC